MKTVLVHHELPEWTDWYVEKLSAAFPKHAFKGSYSAAEDLAFAAETEVFIGIAPKMTPETIAAMPKLEWVQSLTTGIDNLLAMPEMPAEVPISKCVGIQGPQMTELALMMMLSLVRNLPQTLSDQSERNWNRQPQPLLHGKTVCLVGLGSIAENLARVCDTLGMTVTGVSNRRDAPYVSKIFARSELNQAAAEADFVVVLTPLSPETYHLISNDVLSSMKPSAFLINIARGGCVDEAALLSALQNEHIAGAAIDVFEVEPLPENHALWSAPNLILTPHVGGFSDVYHKQCFPIVLENCTAFFADGPIALTEAVRKPRC